jgi:hypothetical protein
MNKSLNDQLQKDIGLSDTDLKVFAEIIAGK